jgi:hypothetical protein
MSDEWESAVRFLISEGTGFSLLAVSLWLFVVRNGGADTRTVLMSGVTSSAAFFTRFIEMVCGAVRGSRFAFRSNQQSANINQSSIINHQSATE